MDINREYVEAERHIVRGFIEPRFMAWQVKLFAPILQRAGIAPYSETPPTDVRSAHLEPVADIAGAIS